MTTRSAIMVRCEVYVDTGGPVTADSFHDYAIALMDALVDLDECNPDIADATVGSDAGQHVITVEMLVFTDDPLTALGQASTVLRTAIHATGAATRGWPISHLENHTERVPDLTGV